MMRQCFQLWSGHPQYAVRDLTVFACALAALWSVAWSFLNYHGRRPVARRQRSVVDTFTMLLFFGVFARLIGRQIGVITGVPPPVEWMGILAGVALVIGGCVVNVMGRHQLGSTWANQVTVYEGHELQTRGLFGLVRHPLYASIIWMFFGTSLAFFNYAALLATLLVFIPAMHYRSGQEERLLEASFPEYEAYRRRTGRFFPKLFSATRKTL